MKSYAAVITTPLGCSLGIRIEDRALTSLDFLFDQSIALSAPSSAFAQAVVDQLNRYFTDPAFSFSLPLNLAGTSFQQRVWQALQAIPMGATVTYGGLAKQLQSSARAVGNACRRNPIPLIVPCHRVMASQHIGGYSGARQGELLAIKRWLIQHEAIK